MRYTSFLLAGAFAALASAQQPSTTVSDAVPSATQQGDPAASSAAAAIAKCLEECAPEDTACRARCVPVPNPNEDQVNETTKCVGECPKGNGTEADTQAYIVCRDGCIAKFYYTGTVGVPQPTGSAGNGGNGNGGSGSGSGSGSGNNPSGTAGGNNPSGTHSGTNAGATGATTTPNAAPLLAGSAGLGLAGLVAAMFL